jgi:RNA polymerase sigma-70 factor (ECF subfamily)
VSVTETALQGGQQAAGLIERIRAGDREAFKDLVGTYQQKVFQLAYAFFGNREDAMDIVQETFLRLHQKIDTFRSGYSLQGWVMQIAKNLCVDYFRKNYRRRKEFESGKSLDELNLPAEENAAAGRAAEVKDILSRCIHKLAEKQRLIFVMRHYNQFQVEEIARILNIAPGTVKSLHFKAVQNLKSRLSPYLGVSR